jgi:DNA-binding HxlR family transcriptional regulator
MILFHLFGGRMLRFSELERAIPAISQKMLRQQIRQLAKDGMVRRRTARWTFLETRCG